MKHLNININIDICSKQELTTEEQQLVDRALAGLVSLVCSIQSFPCRCRLYFWRMASPSSVQTRRMQPSLRGSAVNAPASSLPSRNIPTNPYASLPLLRETEKSRPKSP